MPPVAVSCSKCKDGLHLSCLNPIVIPVIHASSRLLRFSDSMTFTCCDRQDFWTQAVYPDREQGK